MKVVTGAYSTAKIFTDNVEEYAIAQIQMICDNEASKDAKICIMPDVHPGKVGPIGLSMLTSYASYTKPFFAIIKMPEDIEKSSFLLA